MEKHARGCPVVNVHAKSLPSTSNNYYPTTLVNKNAQNISSFTMIFCTVGYLNH